MIAKVPGEENIAGLLLFGGFMRGHDVIIRYGNGTEHKLPSVTAAVIHLNISASTIRKYGKSGKAVDTKFGEVTIRIVEKE